MAYQKWRNRNQMRVQYTWYVKVFNKRNAEHFIAMT